MEIAKGKVDKPVRPATSRARATPSAGDPYDHPRLLQNTIGNHQVTKLLRAGRAGDAPIVSRTDTTEVEASRVAERVVSSPPASQTARATAAISLAPEAAPDLADASGEPLTGATRDFFEPRFGRLERVRVHADDRAAASAAALAAEAFTVGSHIVFGRGRYQPDTHAGRKLLAHELVHVAQQATTGPRIQRQAVDVATGEVEETTTISLDDPLICLAPAPPPPGPTSLPLSVDFNLPAIDHTGRLTGETKRRFHFDEEVIESAPVVLYAVPRAVVAKMLAATGAIADPANATDDEISQALGLIPDGGPPFGTFGPFATSTKPDPPVYGPPARVEPPPAPSLTPADLGPISLRGDFLITTEYSALAVGAGSARVVRSKHGITLIDAGVGPDAHAEITAGVLEQIDRLVGAEPIIEILTTHLHKDHISLLPDLALKYRIGRLRVNAYQLQDPRMLKALKAVARNQAALVADEVRTAALATRLEWETRENAGPLQVTTAERNARWKAHVTALILNELSRAAIRLETLVVDATGEMHVIESPLIGKLRLPQTEHAPVMLERGLLESTSATGGPRISTAQPEIMYDLDELAKEQDAARVTDPKAEVRARNERLDANETTFVIEMEGGARLFVSPDKRARDFASMKALLERDVLRLNAELHKLNRKPATLHVWDISHHAQKGFVTTVSEMKSLIEHMHSLTRVPGASGGATRDIVIVSGQGDPSNPATRSLIDPATIWLLNELSIEVYVATSRQTVEVLEVLLGDQVVAGVAHGKPYRTGIPSEGTLRKSQAALNKIIREIAALKRSRPPRGGPRADYLARVQAHNNQITDLQKLKADIESARHLYLEHYEARLRSEEGQRAGQAGIAVDDTQADLKLASLKDLLADPRVADVTVAEPGPETATFDPVALTLLKRPPGEYSAEQKAIADAVLRADQLRARLEAPHTVVDRARLVKELSELRPLLKQYLDKAPPATKDVVEHTLKSIATELETLTKPAPGTGDVMNTTTEDGAFALEQRTQFQQPAGKGGDLVRWFADKTTRPLGAIMIYTTVRKQAGAQQAFENDTIDLPEYLIGTAHTAYGLSVGVRMLHKLPVSNTEFAFLAVIDVMETASRHYATDAQRNAAITYAIIRGGLNVGLNVVGTAMMRSKNRWVAAAGFLVQFAADPFLEWTGLYDWLEKKWDFLPDEVVTARKRLTELLREYSVLTGLLDLSARPAASLQHLTIGTADASGVIGGEIQKYRARVVDKEAEVLGAFADAYNTVKTSYAGLPELDLMRAHFLDLQFRAHRGDTEHGVASRKQILEAFAPVEEALTLDGMSADAIRSMDQWSEIDDKLDELNLTFAMVKMSYMKSWNDVIKVEGELQQMLGNARYRLDPAPLGLRQTPLLAPCTLARTAYEEELGKREDRAATIHARILGLGALPATTDPLATAMARAEATLAAHRNVLAAVPPLSGLTVERLEDNSFDAGKVYGDYLNQHDDYRVAILKLEFIEQVLLAAMTIIDGFSSVETSAPVSGETVSRITAIRDAATAQKADRVAKGFLFASEAQARVSTLRGEENREIAARFGEAGVQPLSGAERTAVIQRGLPIALNATYSDRLALIPLLSRADADGYMVGVYRYVDRHVPASANALVGDLRRTAQVADAWSDGDRDANLYTPLNQAGEKLWSGGHFFLPSDKLGEGPYGDLPRPILEFTDEEVADNLKRVRMDDLKP